MAYTDNFDGDEDDKQIHFFLHCFGQRLKWRSFQESTVAVRTEPQISPP